jgi:uncharacterized protein
MICQQPYLSSKDRDVATMYSKAMFLPNQRAVELVRQTQVAWLRQRHACGYDYECINGLYDARIRWFYIQFVK